MFKITKKHIELAQLGLSVLEESFNKAQHDENKAHNEEGGEEGSFANAFSQRQRELLSQFGPYGAGKQMIREIMQMTVRHSQFAGENTAMENFRSGMVDSFEEAIEMAAPMQ